LSKVINESVDSARKERQERLQEAVHKHTHSLARYYLEIDANFKRYQMAKRLRTAANQRLDVERASYEEGSNEVDRFLNIIAQYTTAKAIEAQSMMTYNVSIVALEEAKGTLLADRDITVLEEFSRSEKPADRDGFVRCPEGRQYGFDSGRGGRDARAGEADGTGEVGGRSDEPKGFLQRQIDTQGLELFVLDRPREAICNQGNDF
jgi:hypothetical protein